MPKPREILLVLAFLAALTVTVVWNIKVGIPWQAKIANQPIIDRLDRLEQKVDAKTP